MRKVDTAVRFVELEKREQEGLRRYVKNLTRRTKRGWVVVKIYKTPEWNEKLPDNFSELPWLQQRQFRTKGGWLRAVIQSGIEKRRIFRNGQGRWRAR